MVSTPTPVIPGALPLSSAGVGGFVHDDPTMDDGGDELGVVDTLEQGAQKHSHHSNISRVSYDYQSKQF